MGFRVLMIENEVSIKLKLNNLVINKEEKEIWIPVEDLSMIVLDNLKISLTTRMLNTLAESNVGVIICNQKHLPMGFYCSYDNHSRVSKTLGFQLSKSVEYYDELWKMIIQYKITNQAMVLKQLSKDEITQHNILRFAQDVALGDATNREAHAAKVYFNTLMESTFSRGNEDLLLNSGLDYGYAIIRSYLARLCVGYGLNTQLGIHHKNEYNRFNLVDDLIEPLRPLVDLYAYEILKDEVYFTAQHRQQLVNLLNHKIKYKNKKMYIANMMEEYVENIAAFLSERAEYIHFPKVENYIGEEDEV